MLHVWWIPCTKLVFTHPLVFKGSVVFLWFESLCHTNSKYPLKNTRIYTKIDDLIIHTIHLPSWILIGSLNQKLFEPPIFLGGTHAFNHEKSLRDAVPWSYWLDWSLLGEQNFAAHLRKSGRTSRRRIAAKITSNHEKPNRIQVKSAKNLNANILVNIRLYFSQKCPNFGENRRTGPAQLKSQSEHRL